MHSCFSLWEAVWLCASSHYHWYLYTLSTPRSFLCHMHTLNTIISSQPSLPRMNIHTQTCMCAHALASAHTTAALHSHLFKTGSMAGNMLVTYVACLLSLSEKLFVCGWASAYVSPMTIRSGLLWCCWWVGLGGGIPVVGAEKVWRRKDGESTMWDGDFNNIYNTAL